MKNSPFLFLHDLRTKSQVENGCKKKQREDSYLLYLH